MKFLYADDEADWQRIISRSLVDRGHQMDTVVHGEQLLERLESGTYDVVVTDNNMGRGRKTGLDVLRAIRSDPRHKDLPVIVLSGDPDLEESIMELDGLYANKATGMTALLKCIAIIERDKK